MPVSKFQREVLILLARNRSPDSYIAGATVLNRSPDSPRYSKDIDLFHDPAESVAECAKLDLDLLRSTGYEVRVLLERSGFVRATIGRGKERLRLEWVSDTAFRFFPVVADPDWGYRLHEIDAAINKCLALATRSEIRDVIDMIEIHGTMLHLGACCWAACGKDPGFTPDLLLEMIGRNARVTPDMLALEDLRERVDPKALKLRWIEALRDANTLVHELDPDGLGCLFIDSAGNVVSRPMPAERYHRHFGSVRGAWPAPVSGASSKP